MLSPKKRITSHSYRRRIAILITRTLGIMEAKYFLGHEKISSTEAYLERCANTDRIKRVAITLHQITNSKSVAYILVSKEEDLNKQIEELKGKESD